MCVRCYPVAIDGRCFRRGKYVLFTRGLGTEWRIKRRKMNKTRDDTIDKWTLHGGVCANGIRVVERFALIANRIPPDVLTFRGDYHERADSFSRHRPFRVSSTSTSPPSFPSTGLAYFFFLTGNNPERLTRTSDRSVAVSFIQ